MNWKSAYLESRILSASPLELVEILYEHAILAVKEATENLATGNIEVRCRQISKAIAIISELESSLDFVSGGEIATNLARLYQYMRDRLTEANLKRSASLLNEVAGLLETLAEGWKQVALQSASASSAAVTSFPANSAYAAWTDTAQNYGVALSA